MTSSQDLELTIGLELELVFTGSPDFWDKQARYEDPLECVSRLLQEQLGRDHGASFHFTKKGTQLHIPNAWAVVKEGHLVTPAEERTYLKEIGKTWGYVTQEEENAMTLSAHRNYKNAREMHELEIISPILHLSRIDRWTKVLSSIETTLLTIPLGNNATGAAYHYRAMTPRGTGLHVHVARSETSHLRFHTLQNLVAIWGVFEKQLERLQPSHRRNNPYCRSLWHSMPANESSSYTHFTSRIYATKDFEALVAFANPRDEDQDLLADGRYSKLNLTPILNAYLYVGSWADSLAGVLEKGGQKLTVEFREHAGTLVQEAIRRWVELIARVVRFAEILDGEKLTFEVFGDVDVEDLFEMVGLEEPGRVFYRRKIGEYAV